MEKTKNTSNLEIQLPPGFRFHPTDEELIVHYLQKKVISTTLPASIIAEIELYKFNPWELPNKALFGEDEWYFFSPRDRKYPNGVRPNRMAGSGYWKATGTDRPILGTSGEKIVGVKKALVFYKGRPPRGDKTDWIMHEYRLIDSSICRSRRPKESMRLDDWVLCKVRQKTSTPRNFSEDKYGQSIQQPEKMMIGSTDTNPKLGILKDTLFKDCPMLPFIFNSPMDFASIDTRSHFTSFASRSDFASFDTRSSTISLEGSKNSFDSPETSGNFQEPIEGSFKYERKRKENNQEAFTNPPKKLRSKDGLNEEIMSLGMSANEMSLYGGDESDLWSYMSAYQDSSYPTLM